MELAEALEFVRTRKNGVLTTIRANGRPQLSNILYVPGEDDVLRISITDTRAKTVNMRRDPRVSLYVPGETFLKFHARDGSGRTRWAGPDCRTCTPRSSWSLDSHGAQFALR